jgi:peptidoglycan/LPS O-acetylase OafA/YrhL
MFLVLGYHLGGIWKLPGAWVAMDFFFVLSGYLITTLLMKEYTQQGSLNLPRFYQRRARRLGPALLAVLAGVFIAAAFLGGAAEFPNLRWDGIATLFYMANWRFILSAQSYFASFDLSLLRHAWSLAIEEQFYLVWPVVFLALAGVTRLDRRKMLIVLAVVLVASAWWMRQLALGDVDLSRAYFGTDSRGQGLIVGTMMALILWRERWDSPRARRVAGWMGTVAFGVMLVMMVTLSDSSRWVYTHGGFLVVCLTSAVFIFGCARADQGPLQWIFGNKFAVHMGAVSYGFYLWHWPVIILMTPERLDWPPLQLDIARVIVSLLLTELTYWSLEKPIHEQRWVFRRQGLVLGTAFASCLAILLLATQNPGSLAPSIAESGQERSGTASGKRVLVVGDSLAWVLRLTVPAGYPFQVEAIYQGHCDIIGDSIYIGDKTEQAESVCSRWPARWSNGIKGKVEGVVGQPDAVLVSVGLRQLFDIEDNGRRIVVGSATWERRYRAAIKRAVKVIRSETDVPILWLDVPCFRWEGAGTVGEEYDAERLAAVNRALADALSGEEGIEMVPYAQWVCHGADNTESDATLRPDGAHLTKESGEEFWRRLGPQLTRLTSSQI